MPTGYTAPLYEGKDITFEQFALRCSRAMGAAIMQRDEDPDVEIRLREVSDHEQRRVDEARAALDDAQSRTDEEWAAQQAARIEEATKVDDEWIERTDGIHERYQAMRRKVVAWVPPTEEHEGLKKFMLDQLDESEKFDVGSPLERRRMPVPEELPVDVYKANELSRLADQFARAARDLAEEHERVRSQNAWVTALRDSLREHAERESLAEQMGVDKAVKAMAAFARVMSGEVAD
ncbi:hypothetical protein [Microbacterium sp.]|uniref:hypothetical protein n=1 Tax=Microbacterium sp. TaxID=51671 RepID=UPI0039E6625C